MDQRLNFVTLVVSDLAASRRFYVDGLGWSPALEVPDEVAMIQVGDKLVLSLWAESHAVAEIGPVNRGGTMPFTLAYNTVSPAEVDEALAMAAAAGAAVRPAQKRDWGGYSGYFSDPDGVLWEVAHNPHPIGDLSLP
jgi:catechol 2,3-dioxygenase-like lactoylglutathione lyase family enzyme